MKVESSRQPVKSSARPSRPSDTEIRSKLETFKQKKYGSAAKVDISPEAKKKSVQGQQAKQKGEESGEKVAIGDIGINDPSSSNTKEKLRQVLKTGSFSFNPKEQRVLSEILGE